MVGINIRRKYSHTGSQNVLLEKLNEKRGALDNQFTLQIASHMISVSVKQEEHHWWSPEMSLRFEEDDNTTTIFETIGPNPSMFTLAMFFVIFGSVIFLAGLMWALSQIAVGDSPLVSTIATVVAGIVILVTFGVLAMGRFKAKEQVSGLRQFVAEILEP